MLLDPADVGPSACVLTVPEMLVLKNLMNETGLDKWMIHVEKRYFWFLCENLSYFCFSSNKKRYLDYKTTHGF